MKPSNFVSFVHADPAENDKPLAARASAIIEVRSYTFNTAKAPTEEGGEPVVTSTEGVILVTTGGSPVFVKGTVAEVLDKINRIEGDN